MMYHFPHTMYHSKYSSFITLFRFEESSWTVKVLVWHTCSIKTVQNPTDIIDLCPNGQEVYFSCKRWQNQSLEGRNVKTNFAANVFLIFWLKSKKSWIFFLFLSSNIAPWDQAEWTNMHVLKFSDAKNKNNESFLLAWMKHCDWSWWNNRFALL